MAWFNGLESLQNATFFFKKASETMTWVMLFYSANVHRDTFSTSQFPKMPRIWCHATQRDVCSSLIRPDGSAPTALASLLLEPSEPQNNGKKIVLRDFSIFSRACIFFLLFSGSSRLCFFLCPCCREFDF